ncbi:hypothetical protein K8640_17450 [Myxococcus sp. XM-1-1-1]|jgi:hypothetical protein|uniref:hypothetical protein n=1 Tax=Myxococcus sp. XM-1-1-1 TaxID=2874602 RepID=UPI001CC1A0C8|nr:hypothetical protein [Myxococcus sp. XM-1-1-1]MBZ4409993.1 hypothetical protein [Myxococcus sp. XM-1-1-1]
MAEARAVPVWQTRLKADPQRRALHGVMLLVWCAVGLGGLKLGLDLLVEVLRVSFDPAPMGLRSDMRNVQAVGLVLGGLALIAFLTVWLVVGVRVGRFFLRSLWGEDQVSMDTRGVTWRRWNGPGSERCYLPFTEVAAVPKPIGGVELQLHSGRVVRLASLGLSSEHDALWKMLCTLSELGPTPLEPEKSVPRGKETLTLPDGVVVLRDDRGDVAQKAWVRGGVALLLMSSAAMVGWRQSIDGLTVEDTLLAVVLVAAAIWAGLNALPALQARWEWELRPGSLERVWHGLGTPERVRHQVKWLELRRTENEHEGSTWQVFSLWIRTGSGQMELSQAGSQRSRMEHLGDWLAPRLGVRFKRELEE